MWADVLTKPLQEQKFRTMRATLMNCQIDYEEPTTITGTNVLMNAVPIPTASSQGSYSHQNNSNTTFNDKVCDKTSDSFTHKKMNY